MPAALPVIYTRIQDLTDAPTLGAGQDGDALTWDNSAGEFVATSLFTESAADALYYALDDGNSLASDVSTHTGNASLHRVINDSSTASTVLWSASKINTELASKGAGDFLADGSVPMAGDLDLADNAVTSDDGDTEHVFGRAAIGYDGTNSDTATFAHRDRMATSEFAVRQTQVGHTYLNAASTRTLNFCENSLALATMDASNWDFKALEIASDDDDTEHVFGRVAIGYDGTNSDFAAFAHRDRMTANTYAFCQSAAGGSFFNAATGLSLSFRINNAEVANIDASELDIKGLETVSTDGDTAHTFGRALIGDVGFSDHAGFSHRDYANVTDYAMRQTSAGDTIFNCATGGAVQIRVGHVNKFLLNSSVFNVLDTPINSNDDDVVYNFGRASVGYDGTNSDAAVFAHRDQMDSTDYAIRQNASGASFVNAVTGQSISFRINNSEVANLDASDLALASGIALTSADGDTVHTLGRAAIGYDGASGDVAIFSHRDRATAAAAGFRQESDGDAVMNAPTGQTLQFKINNSDVVRVNSSGYLGIGTTSVDSNLHVEASTAAGSITTQTETVAVFEKNADTAIQFKMPNDSEARIYFSTPTAADNGYLSYDAAVPQAHLRIGTTFGYTFGQSSFIHNTDNTASNGTGSFRWTTVYAATGTINTSDRREKRDIQPTSLGLAFVNDLDPVEYRWKSAKSGPKLFQGLIAQDVAATLAKHGVDPDDFAGYVDEGGALGLRYTEFIAPLIRAAQELDAGQSAMRRMIQQLEARLDALEVA